MKNMRELALVPVEEWEKVKSLSNHQKEMKTIKVPKIKRENPLSVDNMELKKKKKKKKRKIIPENSLKMEDTSLPAHPLNHLTPQQASPVKKKRKKKTEEPTNLPTSNKIVQPLLKIEHFSPNYRTYAKKILKFLRKSKKLSYNNKLEIVIEKKVIPHSNIVELIEHALNPKNQSKLPGMTRFYKLLKKAHVPLSLIKNPVGQDIWNKKVVK